MSHALIQTLTLFNSLSLNMKRQTFNGDNPHDYRTTGSGMHCVPSIGL